MKKTEAYKSKILDDLFEEIDPKELEKTRKRMQLAGRIADSMKAKGWKKSHFAEMIGVSPSTITKWLSGTHNFESDTLFEIEAVLGIELVYATEQRTVTKLVFHHVTTADVLVPLNPFGHQSNTPSHEKFCVEDLVKRFKDSKRDRRDLLEIPNVV